MGALPGTVSACDGAQNRRFGRCHGSSRRPGALGVDGTTLNNRANVLTLTGGIYSIDGRGLDVNFRREELMGLSGEDILGRNQRRLYPATRADTYYVQALADHRERGEPLANPVEIERADGITVPVEMTPCPLKFEGWSVVIAVMRDLSSIPASTMKSAEAALHIAQTVADHAGI